MVDWLNEWGEPIPETGRDHANADSHGGTETDGDLPGMMSGEQMQAPEDAPDAEFEQLFLEMMIEHHEGAIEMAKTELDEGRVHPGPRARRGHHVRPAGRDRDHGVPARLTRARRRAGMSQESTPRPAISHSSARKNTHFGGKNARLGTQERTVRRGGGGVGWVSRGRPRAGPRRRRCARSRTRSTVPSARSTRNMLYAGMPSVVHALHLDQQVGAVLPHGVRDRAGRPAGPFASGDLDLGGHGLARPAVEHHDRPRAGAVRVLRLGQDLRRRPGRTPCRRTGRRSRTS